MGEFEAAGELVSGALLARAVEPSAGEGGGHGQVCLNCGTALVGSHCHKCGQAAHVHRSFGAIGHDLLHGVFHFEGKLWHTLPLLAWRPGDLTRRYIRGERARFVSPIALFLFSIFLLFAVFSLAGISPQSLAPTPRTPEQVEKIRQGLLKSRADAVEERAQLTDGSGPARLVDTTISRIDESLANLKLGKPITGPISISDDVEINTGWERLDHGVEKLIKNPSLASYKLQSNSYKFSWLLIPLSLPFVWLMFAWRREFGLYDHAVFVTYSIAFMSLLFIVTTLAMAIGINHELARSVAMTIIPVHFYRQLKGAYGLSRFGAVVRTVLLLFCCLATIVLFILSIVALGVLG